MSGVLLSNKISRRSFLKKTSAITSLASISPFSISSIVSDLSDDKRILVIGAGLAGLSCAYELDKAGYNVILIEARSRAGGRVRTYRDAFADNLYAEMGAEYVDSTDNLVHQYCKDFGLRVLPAKQYDGVFVRGNRLSMKGLKSGQDSLPYDGVLEGKLFGQEARYIQEWIDLVKQKGENSPEVLALDNMSIEEMLKKGGAPKDIIELYTYTNATESTTVPSRMSALYMVLANARASAFSEDTVEGRIFGGNDRLPKIFAKKLGTKIKYNRALKRLKFNSKGLTAIVNQNGANESIKGLKCVIALPASVLRNVDIEPGFSSDKTYCIQNQDYGHVMKVAMQYRKRFWDQKNSIGQRVFTDTRLRRIYHFSIDQPGPRGILLTFTSGEDAKKLGRLSEERRMRNAQKTCENIWPESSKYWENGITKYWNEDPWVKASYSIAGVGQKGFRDILAKPEGPIYFAGEHTAFYRASMNGAIESGLRAKSELIQALEA
jgi:monoamine oxidase|tara:strand:+ start:2260 stop:3735 length:1476 start_codon:yes stop_codon:yes gene_type:complete